MGAWQFCDRDLFGMVSENVTRTQRLLVTSNQGNKRSRIESPGGDVVSSIFPKWCGNRFPTRGFCEKVILKFSLIRIMGPQQLSSILKTYLEVQDT